MVASSISATANAGPAAATGASCELFALPATEPFADATTVAAAAAVPH